MRKAEIVDIYDENRIKTGKTKIRHVDKIEEGEFIIGAQAIILNEKNEILISKRAKTKRILPSKWECNGGAIDSGEDVLDGLIREINEELGITLDRQRAIYLKTAKNEHVFKDIYLFKENIKIDDISFKDGEAEAVMYVSIEKFTEMFSNEEIVYNVNFDKEDYNKCLFLISRRDEQEV